MLEYKNIIRYYLQVIHILPGIQLALRKSQIVLAMQDLIRTSRENTSRTDGKYITMFVV